MLSAIKDVLFNIFDFFSSIIDFVIGLIQDIISFVVSLTEIPSVVVKSLGWIPVEILGAIAACVTVMILLRVIGRD